jgi:hypothetical protein
LQATHALVLVYRKDNFAVGVDIGVASVGKELFLPLA